MLSERLQQVVSFARKFEAVPSLEERRMPVSRGHSNALLLAGQKKCAYVTLFGDRGRVRRVFRYLPHHFDPRSQHQIQLCSSLQFQTLRRRQLAAAKLRMLIAKLDDEFDRAIVQVRLSAFPPSSLRLYKQGLL